MLNDGPSLASENNDVCRFDAVVLGAGISGLVSASILLEQGCKRIVLVEEYDHIGGNHIDCQLGGYSFDIGSFIFQDDSPLLRHFPELLPLYVPIVPTFGRLNPQGLVTRYPISVADDLLAAGPIGLARILLSAAFARLFQRDQTDARRFARYWIGERLLKQSGLEDYMQRFYGVPAERIDVDFARKRMGWIKEHASISNHIRRLFEPPSVVTNTQLARPLEGFAHLYRVARQRLEQHGVTFLVGSPIERVEREQGEFRIWVNGRCASAARAVSTIPIPRIQALCGLPVENNLRTQTLISLFYSFSGDRGFPQPVLFNFSHGGEWKRLTMHSDFYGLVAGREFFCVEVNAGATGMSVALADQDFRRHTAANGLFVGDLALEGSHTLATAYPIYSDGAGERAQAALKALRAFGIESLGRQGGFDYQPTARASTVIAEATLRPN